MATETPTSQITHIPSDQDRRDFARSFVAWTGNPAVADDLAHETLIAAWTSKRQPESTTEWRPWLFGVARNILLRWRRDMAKHGQRIASPPESERHFLAASSTDDLDALMTRVDAGIVGNSGWIARLVTRGSRMVRAPTQCMSIQPIQVTHFLPAPLYPRSARP